MPRDNRGPTGKPATRILLWAAAGAAALLLLALLLGPPSFSAAVGPRPLPDFARKSTVVASAFTYARDHPGDLEGIRCYCGCMMHPHGGRVHQSLRDCFLNGEEYEPHAAECGTCIGEALDVQKMTLQGLPKTEIAQRIDQRYGQNH
ncbi:MAG: hypothetical protein HY558_07145 [Euryarchaeota archaeon]|nr:hypothetical protein [Euryarchaeota archaeon]